MTLDDWVAYLVFLMKLGGLAILGLFLLFCLMVAIATLDRARNPRIWW